jgi:hypothetical protein
MIDEVAIHVCAFDVLSPLGCHYRHNPTDQRWEVTLFASSTETVGGPRDGRKTASKFHLNLSGLVEFFPDVDKFYWQALSLGDEDELGPHVSIEAAYKGNPVWLRILAAPPADFEPGRYAHARDGQLENLW